MSTSRLLGRTTASSGAVEEITAGSGLTLSGGSLAFDGTTISIGALTVTTINGNTFTAGSNTLTLGGNFTTSGAFTTTLTVTANTNVTLPTSGTLITTSAVAAGYQPLDADLTAIAALTTTSFGRAVLELADQAAAQTYFGIGANAVTSAAVIADNALLRGDGGARGVQDSGITVSDLSGGAYTVTGGAANMVITAGTGNSRTLSLQSTTAGGVATTFLTGNADQILGPVGGVLGGSTNYAYSFIAAPTAGMTFSGGNLVLGYGWPALQMDAQSAVFPYFDNNAASTFGSASKRFPKGFFGPSGLKIGDGTAGPTITATGTSPNEALIFGTVGTGHATFRSATTTGKLRIESTGESSSTAGIYFGRSGTTDQHSLVANTYGGSSFQMFAGAVNVIGYAVGGDSKVTVAQTGTEITLAGNTTLTGTNTLKFGAMAAATIGVSADTMAGNLVITPPSTGHVGIVNGKRFDYDISSPGNWYHGASGGFNWNASDWGFRLAIDGNNDNDRTWTFYDVRNSAARAWIFANTGDATFTGGVLSKRIITPDPDSRTVAATESGTVFTNEGAAAMSTFTLPTAVAGYVYTWIVQDTDGITITAGAGDTIRWDTSVTATGGSISSTAIGSSITLVAINATEWVATEIVGTWA